LVKCRENRRDREKESELALLVVGAIQVVELLEGDGACESYHSLLSGSNQGFNKPKIS
jgi:hypothetical protein